MKRTTIIASASLFAAVAIGGIAFASQGYKHEKRAAFAKKVMAMVDTNADQAAGRDELMTFVADRFAKADANGDQTITKSEIVTAIESQTDFERAKKRAGRIADRMVRGFDIDQDGSLTLAEIENRLGKMHSLADWNDDSRVEIEEMKRLRGNRHHGKRKG